MKDFVCCGQNADKPVKHDRLIELFSNHLNPFLLETDFTDLKIYSDIVAFELTGTKLYLWAVCFFLG